MRIVPGFGTCQTGFSETSRVEAGKARGSMFVGEMGEGAVEEITQVAGEQDNDWEGDKDQSRDQFEKQN
jgi:hypothetical protein